MEWGSILTIYYNYFINKRGLLSYYLRNWAMRELIYYNALLISDVY